MSAPISNVRPKPDKVLTLIADYVTKFSVKSADAYDTARYCLMDTLGCGFEALEYPACTKLLGPIVPGTVVPNGAKVPGTQFQLDPVQAAFNIGAMIRWLDFNDTWLAAEWGHPSDSLGGILATADFVSRNSKRPLLMRDVLTAMIKAHEIQGVLALENSFNRVGLDHVVLVKVASTAVVSGLLNLSYEETVNAISQAWVDGQSLRTYRHAPNTGSRKSWAAGDATSRAVRLALISKTGEMGYPSVLTAKTWGFYDVLFKARPFKFQRPFGSYVMENVLFKISFPAEFHAQTAAECAMRVCQDMKSRGKTAEDIRKIRIRTHEAAIRIIDKKGPLNNPADRDHCIQYMVAVPLLFGRLTAEDYQDLAAAYQPLLNDDTIAIGTTRAWSNPNTGNQGTVQLVRRFRCVPEEEILDPPGYKSLYNAELLAMVSARIERIQKGELGVEDFTIRKAREFLETLHAKNVKLYLASGTDQEDLERESAILGYRTLFGDRIYGAVGDVTKEAKRLVLERILSDIGGEAPGRTLAFGDGPVEIRETHKKGGYSVGVASDEVRRYGLNARKRRRLIEAGADIVIPDFCQMNRLIPLLFDV